MSIVKAIKVNHVSTMARKGWGYTYWAFDLHSTIIKPNYEAGNIPTEFYPLALECLAAISKRPEIKMIMYTCSHPHEQEQYLKLFKENGVNFDFINKNPEVKTEEGGYGYYEDKPYINVLFEDKAGFDGNTDWLKVKRLLITMGYMESTKEEVDEVRDKVEDLYINECNCFAFVDNRKLSPKYIEWLERRVLYGPNE
jgi:hypothetical protein